MALAVIVPLLVGGHGVSAAPLDRPTAQEQDSPTAELAPESLATPEQLADQALIERLHPGNAQHVEQMMLVRLVQ